MTEFKNTGKDQLAGTQVTPGSADSVEAAVRAAQVLVGKPANKKNLIPYLVFALVLVLVAGGVYYLSLKNSISLPTAPVPVAVTNQPTMTPTPTPTTAPVSVQDLQNAANSLNISTDSADLTDLNKDIQGL